MLIPIASWLAPLLAIAPQAAGRPEPVEGVARVAGTDRPSPRVVLRFLAPWEPGPTASADDQGRFRWAPPADPPVPVGRDGEGGPECWAVADDPRWEGATVNAGRGGADSSQPNEVAARPVRTRWEVRDGRAVLAVECPPTGELDVLVRGPDGEALADRPVDVYPHGGRAGEERLARRYRARTDARGRFLLRRFEGPAAVRLVVPGVGFGATGEVEVPAGGVARADAPPLARFGRVEGTIVPPPGGAGATILAGACAWDRAQAEVDAEGRFVLPEVVPGMRPLWLRRGDAPAPTIPEVVPVPPGGVARVELGPPDPGPADRFAGGNRQGAVWASGTVRDEAGRPLAGARVLARAESYGYLYLAGSVVESAMTDEAGRFEVRGIVHDMMGPLTVFVAAKGHPPAVAHAMAPRGPGGRPGPLDVVVASRGADLDVAVLRGGRPYPEASVSLWPASSAPPGGVRDPFELDLPRDAAGMDVSVALFPYAKADDDGVARFRDIAPGVYRARVLGLPGPVVPERPGQVEPDPEERKAPAATAEGLVAVVGRPSRFAIELHPLRLDRSFRIARPDGSTFGGQALSFDASRGDSTGPGAPIEADARGVVRWSYFDEPGLWAIDVRPRGAAPARAIVVEGSRERASATIPVSPGLPLADPFDLVVTRPALGSLTVRLLDAEGRPARGTVLVDAAPGALGAIACAGSTDGAGVVRFEGVSAGRLSVRGWVDGVAPPPDARGPGPWPEEGAARGRPFLPRATVEARDGAEAVATLRLVPASYASGTLRPAAGRTTADYRGSARAEDFEFPSFRYDATTGRFLCGPLAPGRLQVGFRDTRGEFDESAGALRSLDVPPGAVVGLDLVAERAADPGSVLPGMGTASVRDTLAALPAGTIGREGRPGGLAGARALLFVPDRRGPTASGVADASGRLTWGGVRFRDEPTPRGPAPGVEAPTAVVWMPGETGAAFVPARPGQPLRAELPPALDASGRVTLGGAPFAGRNARVLVAAAHRGRGVLDDVLRAEASVQADGRFELHGLTPGRYEVQALRDGIWLSPAVAIVVDRDGAPPEVALDIPDPGESILVTVVGPEGRPVVGADVAPVRPPGPLARPRPGVARTDEAGTVVLHGLEAGTHRLVVDGRPARPEVRVRRAEGPAGRPAPVRVEPTPAGE